MKQLFFTLCLLITCTAAGQDPLFDRLRAELDYNHSVLKEQPVPAYYISLRTDEVDFANCAANLGHLTAVGRKSSPTNRLSATMRVGSRELDNTHESTSPQNIFGHDITFDNNEKDFRNTIWTHLDNLYKTELSDYERIKANLAVKVGQEDKSPDFSEELAESYFEERITWESLNVDLNKWNDKVKLYSAVFNENSDLIEGTASFDARLVRTVMVDTEGRDLAYNTVYFRLGISAQTMADNGMELPLHKSWWGHSLNEMPSDEEVIAAAKEISKMLSALRVAPEAESYTGPALLAPEAAGVFFHEIFGHRIEGSRLKQEADAQTFKKKIGELVLPKHFSISFDPNLKYYKGKPLAGYYPVDDEGIRGQQVDIVKKGVLKGFLMSRTPIEGFSKSNGHGRFQLGVPFTVTRQSNMLIESTQKKSHAELLKQLRKEAKAQGKEYAYYFKDVSGGFTQTSRYAPNAFNVSPLVVYRIYVDGRPDELVRGVDMVGTPLAMFSQIDATGDEYGIFNGYCGAETGWVPVSAVSPTLLVKQIETQKKVKGQEQATILPRPQAEINAAGLSKQDIIAQSVKKEVDRSLAGLKKDDLKPPFFISYTLLDANIMQVTSSNGGLCSYGAFPARNYNSRMLIGDYQLTDENFHGQSADGGMWSPQCAEADEAGIRYTMWRSLDSQYKRTAEIYEQKMATLKQVELPEKDRELPDWDQVPVVKRVFPDQEIDMNVDHYVKYLTEMSAILAASTPNLYSNMTLNIIQSTIYFYNTEGTEYRIPYNIIFLNANIVQKDEKGTNSSSGWNYFWDNPKELFTSEEFKKEAHRIASTLESAITAEKLEETYSGPVLFEDDAVKSAFYSNFFSQDFSLVASRKALNTSGQTVGGNSLEEMIGKRVTSSGISVEDLTGTPEYNGRALFGHTPIDIQGVVPAERLVLIENGILKTLLNDRVPTDKVRHSTGHSTLGSPGKGAGVVRMTHSNTKTKDELRKELLRLAQEAGYEYTYVVKAINGDSPELYRLYPDGKEERLLNARINNFNTESFKKLIATSSEEKVHNMMSGSKVSVIVPESILFDELQIQNNGMQNFNRPPLVPRPKISGE